MLQGQPLSPSSRVRAYLPQVARSTPMPQFRHGKARSNRRAPSLPRGSLRPSSGSIETAIATVRFDSKGDNAAPGFIVYRWRDNTVEVVAQT